MNWTNSSVPRWTILFEWQRNKAEISWQNQDMTRYKPKAQRPRLDHEEWWCFLVRKLVPKCGGLLCTITNQRLPHMHHTQTHTHSQDIHTNTDAHDLPARTVWHHHLPFHTQAPTTHKMKQQNGTGRCTNQQGAPVMHGQSMGVTYPRPRKNGLPLESLSKICHLPTLDVTELDRKGHGPKQEFGLTPHGVLKGEVSP